MIFQRSLIRELTQVAMAVFTVLLAIVLTTQVLKLFGRAAAGQLASDAIFAMVGFATLGSFDVVYRDWETCFPVTIRCFPVTIRPSSISQN